MKILFMLMEHFGIYFLVVFIYLKEMLTNLFSTNKFYFHEKNLSKVSAFNTPYN